MKTKNPSRIKLPGKQKAQLVVGSVGSMGSSPSHPPRGAGFQPALPAHRWGAIQFPALCPVLRLCATPLQ